jgi:hypothetical protein
MLGTKVVLYGRLGAATRWDLVTAGETEGMSWDRRNRPDKGAWYARAEGAPVLLLTRWNETARRMKQRSELEVRTLREGGGVRRGSERLL